jgi:hypothetical protein
MREKKEEEEKMGLREKDKEEKEKGPKPPEPSQKTGGENRFKLNHKSEYSICLAL